MAGGKITGSYAETFEGVFSTPAVLTGTVELDSGRSRGAAVCPRRPTRSRSRRRRRRPSWPATSARTVLARPITPRRVAQFLKVAFKFYDAGAGGRHHRRLRADPRLRRRSRRLLRPDRASLRPGALLPGDQGGRRARLPGDRARPTARSAGLLDTFKGLLVWNSVYGNEHMVRAYALARPLSRAVKRAGRRAGRLRATASSATRRVAPACPGSPRSVLRRLGEPACRRRSGPTRSRRSWPEGLDHRRRRRLEDSAGVRRLRSPEGGPRPLDRGPAQRARGDAPAQRSRAARARARGGERRGRRPQHARAGERAGGADERRRSTVGRGSRRRAPRRQGAPDRRRPEPGRLPRRVHRLHVQPGARRHEQQLQRAR